MNRITPVLTLSVLLGAPAISQEAREQTTPAIWRVRTNRPASDISLQLTQGYRAIDLEVRSANPLRFDVTYVANAGDYKKNWSWAYDKTGPEIHAMLTTSRRLLKLTPYLVNGQVRFSAIFVSNTGSNAKGWSWWYDRSFSYIKSRADTLGIRLVDIESYVVGGVRYYCAVGIQNSGADSRTWSVLPYLTMSQVQSVLSAPGYRIYDIERRSPGRFDVIIVKAPAKTYSWYYSDVTFAEMTAAYKQNGARLLDLERYYVNGTPLYSGLMIQNSNELSTSVGVTLRGETDGACGFVLKRLGGSTLAALQRDFVFEPGDVLHQVIGAKAYRDVSTNPNLRPSTKISYRSGPCPYTTGTLHERRLDDSVRRAITIGDARLADALEKEVGGKFALHAFADSIGMTQTRNHRVLGCGSSPRNEMTLNDYTRLHLAIRNGLMGHYREGFLGRFPSSITDFPGMGLRWLEGLIGTAAAQSQLTATELALFRNRFRVVYNHGKGMSRGRFHGAVGGWVEVPFVVDHAIELRQYTFGSFVQDATVAGSSENAISKVVHRLVGDLITAAIPTFKGFQLGDFAKFGTSCKIAGLTPRHEGEGRPELGQIVHLVLKNAPVNQPVLMWAGVSNSQWGSVPLPLDLTIVGAPACSLYVSPDFSFPGTTGAQGELVFTASVVGSKSLIGASVYTQFAIAAPGQNAAGFVTTNGLATTIGGTK